MTITYSGIAFTFVSAMAFASAADLPSSLPDVTVIAPRPPTQEELAGDALPHFVKSHTAPTTVINQIARWRVGICPLTRGLDESSNAFVSARIRAVAEAVGAPHQESPACKPNVEILFTLKPKEILEAVAKHDSQLLGFHYPHQIKALSTMTRPIQGWYVTTTRNYRGQEEVDDPLPLGSEQSNISTPHGYLPNSKVPPGEPGSRLTNRQSSQVVAALVVVDGQATNGMQIAPIADYLAMLTLSQAGSADSCGQLPSILDLLAVTCDRGDKPAQLTAGDIAFLRGLYVVDPELRLDLQESSIESSMIRELKKH